MTFNFIGLKKGDVIPVPYASVSWWYNYGDSDVVIVFSADATNTYVAGEITYFMLTGSLAHLAAFSHDFITRTYQINEEKAEKLSGSQKGVFLLKLSEEEAKTIPNPNEELPNIWTQNMDASSPDPKPPGHRPTHLIHGFYTLQSESLSETEKESSSVPDRNNLVGEEDALNAICIGNDYNDCCMHARKELRSQLGELEFMGIGLNEVSLMASDKQCTLHGEDNNVMIEDDSQEVIVKENGNNWAEVVSKAPNKVDYNLSGIKDDTILVDLDLASSRPLEDICNMGLKPIVESSTQSREI
ncbi:hypothetical protein V6N13_080597 [Hibiscus sabdariffa]